MGIGTFSIMVAVPLVALYIYVLIHEDKMEKKGRKEDDQDAKTS